MAAKGLDKRTYDILIESQKNEITEYLLTKQEDGEKHELKSFFSFIIGIIVRTVFGVDI